MKKYRKNHVTVDFPAYQAWRAQRPSASGTLVDNELPSTAIQTSVPAPVLAPSSDEHATEEKPPYPMSFNKIVDLITTGQPIPGIMEIPDTVLEGQESQSSGPKRKKPWETGDA
jgi:hypothetical protein